MATPSYVHVYTYHHIHTHTHDIHSMLPLLPVIKPLTSPFPRTDSEKQKQSEKSEMESASSVQNPIPNCDLEETIQTRPNNDPWSKKKKKGEIFLEGFLETDGREDMQMQQQGFSRTKSLTEDDLDELKGCLDLGFGFSYEEIPELCNTLPALELCYSMSQRFLDEQQKCPEASAENDSVSSESSSSGAASSPMANWRISSPGDNPEEVKARLRFWAQAVACTVRLCS